MHVGVLPIVGSQTHKTGSKHDYSWIYTGSMSKPDLDPNICVRTSPSPADRPTCRQRLCDEGLHEAVGEDDITPLVAPRHVGEHRGGGGHLEDGAAGEHREEGGAGIGAAPGMERGLCVGKGQVCVWGRCVQSSLCDRWLILSHWAHG